MKTSWLCWNKTHCSECTKANCDCNCHIEKHHIQKVQEALTTFEEVGSNEGWGSEEGYHAGQAFMAEVEKYLEFRKPLL